MNRTTGIVLAALLAGTAACRSRSGVDLMDSSTQLQDYTDYGSKAVKDEVRSLPFKQLLWEYKFSYEISRVTMGFDMLYLETPWPHKVIAVDRFTGEAKWIYDIDTNTPLDWAPVEAHGVPDEIRMLESDLVKKAHEIDVAVKTYGPGEESRKLQKDRDQIKQRLNVAQFGDNVYFISQQTVYCVVRTTGKLLWSRLLRNFIPGGRPFAIRNYVFIPGADRARVWALDTQEGKGRDVASFPTAIGAHDRQITARPVYQDPSLYFVSHDHHVYSYSLTGGLNWTYPTGDELVADPTIYKFSRPYVDEQKRARTFEATYLFIGGMDHAFYAIDAAGGALLWKYETAGQIKTPAIAKDETVYVKTEGGALFALNVFPMHTSKDGSIPPPASAADWPWRRSGELRWKIPLAERFLTKGRQYVYILGPNDEIYAMREMTGEIVGRYPLRLMSHVLTNPRDNILYVANPAGYVFALTESKE